MVEVVGLWAGPLGAVATGLVQACVGVHRHQLRQPGNDDMMMMMMMMMMMI